jgi:hypothetical protein
VCLSVSVILLVVEGSVQVLNIFQIFVSRDCVRILNTDEHAVTINCGFKIIHNL